MNYKNRSKRKKLLLSCAIATSLGGILSQGAAFASDINVTVETNFAEEEAKYTSQQKQIISAKDIERKQAKTAEDIVFDQTGVSRTVDSMGRVGVSIRGAEPRHTLILIDGQPAIGEFAKYMGQADELSRLGTENLDRIEITQGAASAKYGSGAIGGVINVITKKPKDEQQLEFNMESIKPEGSPGILPFSNFFLRADSGKIGNAKYAIWGSKRDVIPVYASKERLNKGLLLSKAEQANFEKNALRFYGTASNAGLAAQYILNDNSKIDIKADHYEDRLNRFIKRTNSFTEPSLQFKRNITRNNYSINYNKDINPLTNLNVEASFATVKEDDVSLMSYMGKSIYRGNNILKYVDNIDHSKLDFRVDAKTMASDKHFISYGVGFSKEEGKGSRLKNAPKRFEKKINPFDYDKNITIDHKARSTNTDLHDFKFTNINGKTEWDKYYEWYGYDPSDKNSKIAPFGYDEFEGKVVYSTGDFMRSLTKDELDRYNKFADLLRAENPEIYDDIWGNDEIKNQHIVRKYYQNISSKINGEDKQVKFNGLPFKTIFNKRNNQITIGEATIKKAYAYVSDDITVDENSTLTPSIRLDHSNLFGSNVTANLGYLHNVAGNPNMRFKANVGTAYSEPGMGELYYNWEMYGGAPYMGGFGGGAARMGWYWVGNPLLQPEKSINLDMGIEAETNKDKYRFTIFQNKIKNYLTAYFTGDEMDFFPEYSENSKIGGARYLYAPDMIYSFKNIGRAEIRGLEAEWKHQFSKRWSTKLGYTYLHAINKSDPTMPSRLLDKPRHKIDIGINYDDEKTGWSGTLYGNYYVDLLDVNDTEGKGNIIESWQEDENHAVIERGYEGKTYKSKTYGIWNFMLQKKWDKDSLAYIGVDNIFNHRDDARALPPRTLRFGVNFKFGRDGKLHQVAKDDNGNEIDLGPIELKDFFQPIINNQKLGTEFYGSYMFQSNTHGGENRPKVRMTPHSDVGSAAKNMLDTSDHGSLDKLTIGMTSHLSKNADLNIEGSLSGTNGLDTAVSVGTTKALNKAKLEKANIATQAKKWTYALGKMNEKLGTTGYYFNNSFIGAKAMYTNHKTQVSIGYGDFKHSTGIKDSAYTRSQYLAFRRPPTIEEFVGSNTFGDPLKSIQNITGRGINYFEQIQNAKTNEERYKLMREFIDIVKNSYPEALEYKDEYKLKIDIPDIEYKYKGDVMQNVNGKPTVKTKGEIFSSKAYIGGALAYSSKENEKKLYEDLELAFNLSDPKVLEGDGTPFINNWFDSHRDKFADAVYHVTNNPYKDNPITEGTLKSDFKYMHMWDDLDKDPVRYENELKKFIDENIDKGTWVENKSFVKLDKSIDEIKDDFIKNNLVLDEGNRDKMPRLISNVFSKVRSNLYWDTEQGNRYPREKLKYASGATLPAYGIVLSADSVPSINKALFVDISHKFNGKFGAKLWYLHSMNDGNHDYFQANTSVENNELKSFNDKYSFNHVANVIGLGFKYQLGQTTSLSMDMGKNFTSLGKYLNGTAGYQYDLENKEATIRGYQKGSAPLFYTLRFDIGKADFNTKGSWSSFLDYKHFEHGSFFGGNGTDSLPDRYLDGIKSFTVGGSYVPRKNLMLNVSYTFGAEGINKRDTLFGPEKFKLGNYSRIEMIYKF